MKQNSISLIKQCSWLANFKNISLSLSNRHQHWICYEMASHNFIASEIECGPSLQSTILKNETQEFQSTLQQLISVDIETIVTQPSWVKCFSVYTSL